MYSPSFNTRRRRSNKEKERNLASSVLCMIVIALISTALAQPRWFYLKGGACPYNYLGVYEFFDYGRTVEEPSNFDTTTTTKHVYHEHKMTLDLCVNQRIVIMMRMVIVFCFFGIMSSMFAFILDTCGVTTKTLKVVRKNAAGSIFTVLFTVVIIGLCYYVSTLIEDQQETTKSHIGTKVEVKFDVSFYLITAAGSISVLATATNLLRKNTSVDSDSVNNLLDDYDDGLETFSVGYPSRVEISPMHFMPPPPPYTP